MEVGALLQNEVWAEFVASTTIDQAHADMHGALCSCLEELSAEFRAVDALMGKQ